MHNDRRGEGGQYEFLANIFECEVDLVRPRFKTFEIKEC
jgi:hypothetical protein